MSGLRAWTIQRISAIYIAIFSVAVFIGTLVNGLPDSHEGWTGLLGSPFYNLATLAFIVALLLHAWVGARDVIVDYVHPLAARFTVLSLAAVFLIVCGLWAARVLINVL